MNVRLLAVALAALTATAANAAQQTIDFEGLPFSVIDTTYDGFSLTGGEGLYSWVGMPSSIPVFGGEEAHSGTGFAWSNGGTTLDMSEADGAKFDVESLWTRIPDGSAQLLATGYANGVEVFSKTFTEGGTYALDTLAFNNIDKLELAVDRNLLVDDITVGTAAAAVPEPAAPAMLLAGLGVLGLIARRRKI